MPAAELVVWLIPGYIALLLYLHAYPLRTKQSYEWFFQAAGFGVVCFITARSLVGLGELSAEWLPAVGGYHLSVDIARTWWHAHVPFAYSFSLLIGVMTAPLAALTLSRLRPVWEWLKTAMRKASPETPPSDIFYFSCRKLERKLVIVSVDGGKVYVGFLVDYTSDPDEPEKYIKLLPIMSGRRPPNEPYVEFTTPYVTSATEPTDEEVDKLAEARGLLIPIKKIVTFAPFDRDLHQWFLEHDMVSIKFNIETPPEGNAA